MSKSNRTSNVFEEMQNSLSLKFGRELSDFVLSSLQEEENITSVGESAMQLGESFKKMKKNVGFNYEEMISNLNKVRFNGLNDRLNQEIRSEIIGFIEQKSGVLNHNKSEAKVKKSASLPVIKEEKEGQQRTIPNSLSSRQFTRHDRNILPVVEEEKEGSRPSTAPSSLLSKQFTRHDRNVLDSIGKSNLR
jgi:hypothetical protein